MFKKFIYITLIANLINSAFADNLNTTKTSQVSTPNQTILTRNKIIAFINKRIITQNQLNIQINQARLTMQQKGINLSSAEIRSKVLDQMILQQIELDMANRNGIKTNDNEINTAIDNIMKTQQTTFDKFKLTLAEQGTTLEQFRRQVQDQITIEKLKQRQVDGRVTVNDDEVERVLNSEAYKHKIDYKLSDIIIDTPERATKEIVSTKQALANQAYQELKADISFSKVAIKYSTAPNALTGGELGWKANSALPPLISQQLAQLNKGDFTNVITMPVGFFIFRIDDVKQHGTPQIIRQYHVRHILIKVNEDMSDDEAHSKIQQIYNQLALDKNDPAKLNLDFAKLAKENSQDTSSIKGGDLGWLTKGDTVPQFEQGVLTTPIGTISQPIRSPFGWHILEVTDIRDSNLTNDREKAEIRQSLRDLKANILYEEWVRNLRETAYVKINDE